MSAELYKYHICFVFFQINYMVSYKCNLESFSTCSSSSLLCPSGIVVSIAIAGFLGIYRLVHVEALMEVVNPSDVKPYPTKLMGNS